MAMPSPAFAVTWDYRCPFARNAHEHLVAALQAGAQWDVRFAAFSLDQVHVDDGGLDVWDDPAKGRDLRAMQVGIVVRDRFPERFLDVHIALFAARHDEGRDIRDDDVLRAVLTEQGVDADVVFTEVEDGRPLEAFRNEHEQLVGDHKVFGVPTFVVDDRAVFVRLMDRPHGDTELGRRSVERVLDLMVGWPELNEFKHTSVPR